MTSYDFGKTINDNLDNLKPPVCNKMLHNAGPLKVMIVGGPNIRKDYHLNQGEELFFQVKGDMCLKVMEMGTPKDVVIKEGEIFMLPGGVPHSPQRFENTIGLVIERERHPESEFDGLRYYVDETNQAVLWQRFFHCKDLGKELVPLIKSYFDCEEHKTRVPTAESVQPAPWEEDKQVMLRPPYPLASRIAELKPGGKSPRVPSKEFVVELIGNGTTVPPLPITTECWVWQLEGSSTLNGQTLNKNNCVLLDKGITDWHIGEAFCPLSPSNRSSTNMMREASDSETSPVPSGDLHDSIALLVYCTSPNAVAAHSGGDDSHANGAE